MSWKRTDGSSLEVLVFFLRFKSGARYVGNYITGKKNGEGEFYYPDGSQYSGSWVNDQKHGWGTYTYPNKDRYEGEWMNDKRHGQGTYLYAQTGSIYEGTWSHGKMQGSGQLIHGNHRYIGTFEDDKAKGKGKYMFDMGCELHGHYSWVDREIQNIDDEDDPEQLIDVMWNGKKLYEIQKE